MLESKSNLLLVWCLVSAALGFGLAFIVSPIIPPEMQSSEYNRGVEAGKNLAFQQYREAYESGFAAGKEWNPIDMDAVLNTAKEPSVNPK